MKLCAMAKAKTEGELIREILEELDKLPKEANLFGHVDRIRQSVNELAAVQIAKEMRKQF